MTRRSRIAIVVGLVALLAWWGAGRDRAVPAVAPVAADRASGPAIRDALAQLRAARGALAGAAAGEVDLAGGVTISGRVVDLGQQQPVGDVEVVFRGAEGEATTMSAADGTYAIRVPAGVYRAFVRDDAVVSFAPAAPERLPGPPMAAAAGLPDDALMTLVFAHRDSTGVDLAVVGGGIVTGRVVDREGRPIADAVVRARNGWLRPALGTDVAESDRDGRFELRLPSGSYVVDATHPSFAGVLAPPEEAPMLDLLAGARVEKTFVLTAGCIITGRVVGADGRPAGDGAIERSLGRDAFRPVGQIEPDGTFRWASTEELDVTLRAWPWRSPHSESQSFTCRASARFTDVVFRLPDQRPDLEGVLVDRAGAPVGHAFIDVIPLEERGFGQQERTDAQGRWAVYRVPAGRYRLAAQAQGRGITQTTVTAPSAGVRLVLGGTGRLEGTTPRVPAGSFELALGTCNDGGFISPVPEARRFVRVTDGRFAVDDLPACALSFSAVWRGTTTAASVAIPSGGTAHVVLDVGPPRPKTVHGVVRDASGAPVANAQVGARDPGNPSALTGADGAYTLRTFAGASLHASAARGSGRDMDSVQVGFAQVSHQPSDEEQIDIQVHSMADQVHPRDPSDDAETETED
jgi:hypothetical protein